MILLEVVPGKNGTGNNGTGNNGTYGKVSKNSLFPMIGFGKMVWGLDWGGG